MKNNLNKDKQKENKMKIYLLRHVETIHNSEGRFYGDGDDISFTERGNKQLEAIHQYFQNIPLTQVVSSPVERCVMAAKEITSKSIQLNEQLKDFNMGIYKGLDKKEIQEKYPEIEKQRLSNLYEFIYPEGESHKQCEERVWTAFNEIITNANGDIAIVTHAAPVFLIIKKILGISFSEAKKIFVYPGSVSILSYDGKSFAVEQQPKSLIESDYSDLKKLVTNADDEKNNT